MNDKVSIRIREFDRLYRVNDINLNFNEVQQIIESRLESDYPEYTFEIYEKMYYKENSEPSAEKMVLNYILNKKNQEDDKTDSIFKTFTADVLEN